MAQRRAHNRNVRILAANNHGLDDPAVECGFPDCEKRSTVEWDLPLCDRHILTVYRKVAERMGMLIAGRTRDPDWVEDGPIPESYYQPRPINYRPIYPAHPLGSVYYVRLGNMVKIGFTTDMTTRMQTIPHEEILHVRPGTMHDERVEHRRWAHLRRTGEWFLAETELLDHIASLD